MSVVVLYLATAVVFLVLDAIMLTFVMAPLFQRHIGDMMTDQVRFVPAAIFYLAYVAGLVALVSWPAWKNGSAVVLPAAIVGAMAYGTYEFTSYAIMKGWSPTMVATDLIWGTFLTAFSAWAGLAITRAIVHS
jgi:uncharacterized membrane protein